MDQIPSVNQQSIDCHMSDLSTNISAQPAPLPSSIPSSSNNPSFKPPTLPICEFGPRLGFTCFSNPIPDANFLNSIQSSSVSTKNPAHSDQSPYWFTIDSVLVYLSFYQDTGPLNCACLYRFCLHLHGLLEDQSISNKRIVLYSSDDPDKKANAALLMALYCMIVLRWNPADALHPISHLEFQPFRDAGYSRADFNLSIQNVLFGLKRAIELRLLRLDEFDLKEYETFEKVEHGDYNWLSPHFIAFASPVESSNGRIGKAFKLLLDQFERVGVNLVIRLNKKLYDENRFIERGIAHREMYFDDGTNPTMEMVKEFITICDRIIQDGGVVAVHCKAGLGRTGTLIGAYLIYKYNFTAEEAIGFMRVMRPGTCVGPQQHFLYDNQLTWIKWSARDELLAEQQTQISPSKLERPITPPPESTATAVLPSATTTPPPNPISGAATAIANPTATATIATAPRSAVPGQPRKTPGAKTRHMVAEPEARPTGKSLIEQEEAQEQMDSEEMELTLAVPLPPPSTSSRMIGIKDVPASPVKPPKIASVVKPRPRPASVMSDNRPTVNSTAGIVRRSKAVKDLGTLFEGPPPKTTAGGIGTNGPKPSAPTRYNLRGGSRLAGTDQLQANSINTPSRLPQRIMAKKRGCVGANNHTSSTYTDMASNAQVQIKPVGPRSTHQHHRGTTTLTTGGNQLSGNKGDQDDDGLLGVERSVRRRRSSLSHTDLAL
ncbi:hypothetical protein O181_085070 [Austropuccinia psidii MF-1]|uniref:protein-tyrosine-phosphatase n=1 Tax=Austropuccinia psidii MF-1 TaxID=1389203 RepID=A0A9Q3FRG0_9BASI|nr:hypothetical protein [Austropuccinia psidii MF-1]